MIKTMKPLSIERISIFIKDIVKTKDYDIFG